jgi:hypothetical protein
MADAATWSKRIAEWRASGLTAEEFCEARDFGVAGLYAWSSRLRRSGQRRTGTAVRIARVETKRAAEVHAEVGLAAATSVTTGGTPLVVELGDARVIIGAGVQRALLELVLDVLDARARGGRT